jgi:hypothetical protein
MQCRRNDAPPAAYSSRLAWGMVAAPLLAIFAPVLFQDRSFAFRDTAAFYYPLFQWIEQQWQAGTPPLWNPHVNYGTPVVGDASSSVFYPGKLLFALPVEFSWKFKLYVMGHAALAAATAYWAARQWGVSRAAAALAAIAYSCGGSVLFQYCNVVYLVGAAWLPLATTYAERAVARRSTCNAVALGVVLATMTLGGDPQMAYHVALATGGYALATVWLARRSAAEPSAAVASPGKLPSESTMSLWLNLVRVLAAAASVSFVLAAVQILPASEASARSDRAAYHAPRNIYEGIYTATTKPGGRALASQGLFQPRETETHAATIYGFSWAPWHLVEFVWPGASGEYFPQYRRWMMFHAQEPRMWSPSVYFGLLPVLLAVASLRLRKKSHVREQWLSWCAVLAILGSFGAFGAGWLLRQPLYGLGKFEWAAQLPGDPVGGVYWFCTTFLPGYAYFRYPAKLLTFAAWPLCLLAAQGLDRLRYHDLPRLRTGLFAVAALSAALLAALALSKDGFAALTASILPDTAYGPFDTEGAFRDLLRSLLHTLVLASLLGWILARQRGFLAKYRLPVLVAITAIEIGIANAPLIATAPSAIWRERPRLTEVLEHDAAHLQESPPPRVRPQPASEVTGWEATASPRRLEELAAADRHAMTMNHCLAGPIDAVESLTSLRLADYYWFRRYHQYDDAYWGNYWLMSAADKHADHGPWCRLPAPQFEQITRATLYRHRDPFPRAWIVHDVVALPPLISRDPYRLDARGAEVAGVDPASRSGGRRDFRRQAVVETNLPLEPQPESVAPGGAAHETCQILVSEPNRVVIDARLPSPGLLVLGDTYFPGWTAHSAAADGTPAQELSILRTNRCFRGVLLAAGQHRITFEYRPKALYVGAAISGAGWLLLLVFSLLSAFYARKRQATEARGKPA